jgi:hypothetical protein
MFDSTCSMPVIPCRGSLGAVDFLTGRGCAIMLSTRRFADSLTHHEPSL